MDLSVCRRAMNAAEMHGNGAILLDGACDQDPKTSDPGSFRCRCTVAVLRCRRSLLIHSAVLPAPAEAVLRNILAILDILSVPRTLLTVPHTLAAAAKPHRLSASIIASIMVANFFIPFMVGSLLRIFLVPFREHLDYAPPS